MRQPLSFLRNITTNDAHSEVDGRAMPAFVNFWISYITASRTYLYGRRRTGCHCAHIACINLVNRKARRADVSVIFSEYVQILYNLKRQ